MSNLKEHLGFLRIRMGERRHCGTTQAWILDHLHIASCILQLDFGWGFFLLFAESTVVFNMTSKSKGQNIQWNQG
jgi:hypothetical protein